MLAVIKLVVDDNVIHLSATQVIHAPVHCACNTVQQLLCKDLGSLQRREYELQGNKTEEINQRLVELGGKAVIQHLSENLQFSCLRVSPGGAEALVR